MAISNTVSPAAMHPAYNPVLWSFTSNRYQSNASTVTGVANVGDGFCTFTTSSPHGFVVGDFVTGSTFTPYTMFNVTKMEVTGVASITVTTNLVWTTAMATDTGILTRNNDSFQLKCEIKVNGVVIGTKYVEADNTGTFTVDISGILQSQLSEDILALATTALTTTNANSVCHYTLVLTEQYENASNLMQDKDTLTIADLSSADILAYNWAKQDDETFADYICVGSDDKFLTDILNNSKVLHTDYLQFSFITTVAAVYGYQGRDGSSYSRIPAAGSVTPVHGRCILPIPANLIESANTYITVVIKNNADDSVISETKTLYVDHRDYYKVSTLMFKNHYGAFDTYSFIDRTIYINNKRDLYFDETTEKTHYIDANETWELKGRYETTSMLTWLQELYTAKVVYLIEDTALTRVNIVSTKNTVEDRDPFQPVIEIKKQPLKLN
jgi:hypothetical protein